VEMENEIVSTQDARRSVRGRGRGRDRETQDRKTKQLALLDFKSLLVFLRGADTWTCGVVTLQGAVLTRGVWVALCEKKHGM